MKCRGESGSIINIGSGWRLKGGPDAAAYCAAKGGIVNLTRAMAIDHGPASIRVNCVCPGDTDTPLLGMEGLSRYGFADDAGYMARKLLQAAEGLAGDAPIRENYNPETGAGLNAANFSWSAACFYLLVIK